ncbi:MAG: polysaccharide deacetylase family protein [Crocinitomicaceae bacterium]|nr:polysaccharide deacetylase family protein [Crocinitomicaceae bacterium]
MKHRVNILLYALSVTLICLFLRDNDYFVLMLIGVTFIFFVALSLGVLFMQYNYFLKSTTELSSDKCLLTFDDGPHPTNTIKILDILAKHEVKALFFVIGEKAEQHPEIIKRIVIEGHLIGNHSYNHNNFMSMYSKSRLRKELTKAQEALWKISGQQVQFFRPPIGYTNPNYASILKEMKLKCIGWTVRSYDTVHKESSKLNERLVSMTKPGNIVLLHDNLDVSANALDTYITSAKSNGILFASSDNIKTIFDA